MQLTLLGIAFDGAAKTHAPLILLFATGLAVELAAVVGVPEHEAISQNRYGEISIDVMDDKLKSGRLRDREGERRLSRRAS